MSGPEAFERCMAVGGVAVFPADTVYGLACDPGNRFAVERLCLMKRRSLDKPSAVMFFDVELALQSLPELGDRTRTALLRLLPGGVTPLLPNPAGRFPLACGGDRGTLGLRVPVVSAPELDGIRWPVLQSSANRAGGPDPRRLDDVPELIRAGADLVIDGGELPGTPSSVVDLRRYEETGEWSVVRLGAVPASELESALRGQFHFDPTSYPAMIRSEVPSYDRLQKEVVAAASAPAGSGPSGRREAPAGPGQSGGREASAGPGRILELGTGTGETTRRLLARFPDAVVVGIDATASMLERARESLPAPRVDLRVGRLEEPLPDGPFDLVVSALCVHHLDAPGKADLFKRIAGVLAPGGRFLLGDVVVPLDPVDARTPLTPAFDRPSTVADQLSWLRDAGFAATVAWEEGDLAVIVADLGVDR